MGGKVSGIEPHDRDSPAVQLGDHKVRGGVIQIGDNHDRPVSVSHWSLSFPVS
jgi:hypothetical protein